MTAVWLLARSVLRRRWAALVAIAMLIGLVGGVVLTAAAGARRTATAYPRLLSWARAAQLDISPLGTSLSNPDGTGTTGYYAALRREPDVAYMSAAALLTMALPSGRGSPDLNINVIGSLDAHAGDAADRVRVLAGSLAKPGDAHAAMIDSQLASRLHLRPGSTLRLLGIRNALTTTPDLTHPVKLAFRVSAVVAFDDQVVATDPVTAEPRIMLTPAFTFSAAARQLRTGEYAGIRLRPGATAEDFERAATALAKRYPKAVGRIATISLHANQSATQQAIRPQVFALAAFAALAGLIILGIFGQLLSRQVILDAAEFPTLRALGMPPRRLVLVSLLTTTLVTTAGAAISVVVAIAASPLMPIGPARLAEPNPGVEINVAALGLGFVTIMLLPVALTVPTAWRVARHAVAPLKVAERPTRISRLLSPRAGLITADIGIRMAFEPGRGRTAVPVRSALGGTIVAISSLVAALVFGTSLVNLVDSPHLYGQNWVLKLDMQQPSVSRSQVRAVLAGLPDVTGYAAGDYGEVSLGGTQTPAIGIDPISGDNFVTVLRGRVPVNGDEVALGAGTMRAHNWRFGQRISVIPTALPMGRPQVPKIMRIVGEVILPSFSEGGFAATNLGQGAVIAAPMLSTPYPPAGCTGPTTCYSFALVRYRPGTDLDVATRQLQAALTANHCPPGCATFSANQRPADIQNYASVRGTPLALSAMLALLAIAALAHVLLTSVRRRRRDLAILKTLGLRRAQLIQVVSWQASSMAAAALVFGVPLGLLAGRWTWQMFAASAGVSPDLKIPALIVFLTIPATLVAAILMAARPGWEAARIQPAVLLRGD